MSRKGKEIGQEQRMANKVFERILKYRWKDEKAKRPQLIN
jgi:hypothetical protein